MLAIITKFRQICCPTVKLLQTPVDITAPLLNRSFHFLTTRTTIGTPTATPTSFAAINSNSELLKSFSPIINLINGFKVKGRLRRRCKDCNFVVRQERLYVICKTHPRHKQMSMKKKEKNTWILTDATQSKVRQW